MSSSAPAERAGRLRALATPVAGAASVLLGGACWKLALAVTAILADADAPTILGRLVTGLALDAAAASLALFVCQRLPRLAPIAIMLGVVGALDVYAAAVIGGPLTPHVLAYASSLRPSMLAPLPALATVVAVAVVVAGAARLGWVRPRVFAGALAVIFVTGLAGVALEGATGSSAARARLGLDRHHLVALVPHGSVAFAAADAAVVSDLDPETPARRAPIAVMAPSSPPSSPRHVVLVVLESMAVRHIDDATMPFLQQLGADHAVVFEDHTAESPVSIKALFALLCGLPPLPESALETERIPRIDCRSLPEVLAARGVVAGFFHGGYFAFTDKLAFLAERGFSTLVDGENLADRDRHWKNGWGVDDRAVVDEALRFLDGRVAAGEPSLSVVVPLIPHYEYFLPDDAPRPFGTGTIVARYKNGLRFADGVLERLVEGYRARGVFDDTVFVVVGDHGEAFDEHPGNRLHGSFLYEENLRAPLVIRDPSLPAGQQRSARPSTHADVAPTILSLLGVPAPQRAGGLDGIAGQDLLSPTFRPSPSVHFTSYPEPRLAVRAPTKKLIVDRATDATALYDRRIPGERQTLDDDALITSLRAFGETTLARRRRLLLQAPVLGASYLQRASLSSSLPLTSARVFNMVRQCIPLSTTPSGPTTLTLRGLDPPARFVGVGVIDESRHRREGGLSIQITAGDGTVSDVVVDDRFESSSRVVAVPPSMALTVVAAPSPRSARGCLWVTP